MAVAMQLVHQITTVSLMMALPAWGGNALDERFGTGPWLVSVGAILGFAVGMLHLVKLTGGTGKQRHSNNGDSGT